MVTVILLIIMFSGFGIYDMLYKKVNNKAITIVFITALVIGIITSGMAFSLKGVACGFVLTLLMYFFGAIGAGDVKFFAAVGAIAGSRLVSEILMYSIFTAGFVGIILILISVIKKKELSAVLKQKLPFIPQSFLGLMLAIFV